MGRQEMDSRTIRLRPLSMDDYEAVLRWSQDPAFCEANEWEANRKPEEIYSWWQHCVTTLPPDFIRMAIEVDGAIAGYVDLAEITEDSAEFGIAIGESSWWGKGIGLQAASLLVEHAWKERKLSFLTAETYGRNARSRNLLNRLGFKETGQAGQEPFSGMMDSLIQYRLQR